jgi:hypothetical protein
MAQIKQGTLKERKRLEAEREAMIQQVLVRRSKALEEDKREKKRKKKTVSELMTCLNLCGVESKMLHPINTYIPKSHNLEKQMYGLINHLFVRYPVPAFLYTAFRLDIHDRFKDKQELYRQWFVTLAQGGSFTKQVREFMTSREAFMFLSVPANKPIHENVWWAKMKVAGLPPGIIEMLICGTLSR